MSATNILQGYRPIQLPDLSNKRRRNHRTLPLFHTIPLDEHIPTHVNNTALDSLILVAYANVLGMYCGATDVLVSLEDVYGPPLPFRLQWEETTTWQNALAAASVALRRTTSEDSQSLSAEGLQVIEDDRDDPPSVAFFRDSFRASGHSTTGTTPFSRLPLLIHTGDGLLHFYSSSDFFCDSTVSVFLRHILAVVSQAFVDATQKIAAPLHLNDDLSSVVEALSEHELAGFYPHIPPTRFATDYILPHSTSTPDAIAVQWYPNLSPDTVAFQIPECLSYSDLNSFANRFARFLLGKGLSSQDRVAVCMDRDPMYHSVLFGILRAGGCYVPIDPELPTERKLFIANNSSAKFVITSSRSRTYDLFGDLSIDIHDVSVEETIFNTNDAEINLALPGNTAYMLYTSGTTGNPKGCLITHIGLTEAIMALSSYSADVKMADIRKGRYLAIASIAFDVHLAEVFVPLSLGMTLVSAKRSELLENVPLYINLLGITHVGLVPSLIDATMCAVGDGDEMKLRYIGSGGEKISDSILDKWADHPYVRLANFYGPSEVSIGCCARFMDIDTPRESIGRAFANVSSYVVDDSLNILPRGVVGELVVAGPLVGEGYHELPDLTAKSFMEWPCRGSWSYRTGDLVRMLPDGTLHIIGRIDTQIKLRGVRIEAEGISAVFRRAALDELGLQLNVGTILVAHPSIGNGATPQLVAFVAWDVHAPISLRRTTKPHVVSFEDGIRQILQTISERELASYMRPAHIVRVSWLPLNPNGKMDEKTLSAMFREIDLRQLVGTTVPDTSMENQVSLTDVQRKLISLVENHVKVSPIDLRASIFAYGMDSLSLVPLVSDIRQTFQVSVAVADIMKAVSIKAIGELIETYPSPEPASLSNRVLRLFSEQWLHTVEEGFPGIQVGHVLPPFPIQEGVLYHSDSHPASCVQHITMSIPHNVPLPQVRDAWEATMKKLGILRTIFYFGRQLVQVVLASTSTELPWTEERTHFMDADSFCNFFHTEVAPSLAKQINRTTSTSPLFRLVVFSTPNPHHDHWLTLSIHHALFDGISLPLILKFAEDELLARPHPNTCSSESLLEYMHSIEVDIGRQFWQTMFSGFNWSGHRLANTLSSSQKVRRKVMPLNTSLTALAKLLIPHQVTMQSALTCAFAQSLAKYIRHTDDIAFVVVRAGRLLPVEGAERAVCPTINALPTRVRFDTKGYLHRVQADISAAVAFEHFPLSHVQRWLPPGTAPFDTLLAVTVKDNTQFEAWNILRSELPVPDFPLSTEILLDKSNDTLVIQAAYYDCKTLTIGVDNIFRHFETILLDILNESDNYVTPPAHVDPYTNLVSSTSLIQPHDTVEEELEESLNTNDLALMKETVSDFFAFPFDRLLPNTSLISLGLDSIRSVGLARALRQHGYSINAADIMGNSTIWKLCSFCAQSHGDSVQVEIDQGTHYLQEQRERIEASFDPSTCKLSIDDEIEVFPTTALQAGMISQTIASTGNLYFHTFVLELGSDTNLAVLQNAWKRAIHDFGILRTTFHYVADLASWVQVRHSVVDLDWQECILTLSRSFQHTVDELFSDLKPIDEASLRRPPIYLRILRSDASNPHLVLFIHHALYDGFSIPILLSHVEHVYRNQEITPPTQFFDFIPHMLFQHDSATRYWAKRLQNYHPVPQLARSTSGLSRAIIASKLVSVQQELLVELVHDNAITIQCLAQAVWAKYLSSLNSSSDVIFGHVVSGRSFHDSENVVGPMFNTILCRVQFPPNMSNRQLLQSIHHANVSALPWQHASLRVVQSELQLQGFLTSLFLFQPRQSNVHSPLWTLREQEEFDPQIQYPLNIEFHEVEDGFLVKMACQSEVMNTEMLADALASIAELMNEMVHHLDDPVADTHPRTSIHSVNVPKLDPPPLDEAIPIPPELLTVLASVTHCPADSLSHSQSLVAIGVDSITAISVSAKCKKLGLTISVGDIVSSFTIGDLAGKVNRVDLGNVTLSDNLALVQISTAERQAILERFSEGRRKQIVSISAATEGMKWLIGAWQRSLGQRFHHVFAYKLSPHVNIQQLRAAWKTLVAYHPILRSTFASAPGFTDPRVVTFLSDSMEVDLEEECVDHLGLDPIGLANRMKSIVLSPLSISAAQSKGFLITSTLTNHQYLLIRMHHFQYDAFSLQLLLEDLSSIYLGSPPRNTSDAHAFLAVFAPSSLNLSEQRQYWQSVMPMPFLPRYLPPLVQEKHQPRSPQRTLVTITSAIPGAAELKKQAQAAQLPLHCILLASWAWVQAFRSSSDHATFGLWQAGRTGSVPNVLNLAIPCMNVLPIHVSLSDDLLEVARRVQQDLQKRTPVIQQSHLRDIDEWITEGKCLPLTNVCVNVFERARGENRQENSLFSFVETDHIIPAEPLIYKESAVIDALPITSLIQDDVMVDIVINETIDAITMSIESTPAIMDIVRAREIIDEWAMGVRRSLSPSV